MKEIIKAIQLNLAELTEEEALMVLEYITMLIRMRRSFFMETIYQRS